MVCISLELIVFRRATEGSTLRVEVSVLRVADTNLDETIGDEVPLAVQAVQLCVVQFLDVRFELGGQLFPETLTLFNLGDSLLVRLSAHEDAQWGTTQLVWIGELVEVVPVEIES